MCEPLFVWRLDNDAWWPGSQDESGPVIFSIFSTNEVFLETPGRCKYCDTELRHFEYYGPHIGGRKTRCEFCGWGEDRGYYEDEDLSEPIDVEKILKYFPINSSQLSFDELGAYLYRNYQRVYDLSPRRFELLVADVFANSGFRVEVTKSTRDGGRDLILFSSGEEQSIVEIKRYRNKVGVDLVRQLRGVQLRDDIRKAVLVTASHFTADAIEESKAEIPLRHGFQMELMDAENLLKLLSVYNLKAPSLVEVRKLRQLHVKSRRAK